MLGTENRWDRMDRRKHAASLQIRAGVGFLGAFAMALKASEEACTVGGFMVLLDCTRWTVSKRLPSCILTKQGMGRFKCIYPTSSLSKIRASC